MSNRVRWFVLIIVVIVMVAAFATAAGACPGGSIVFCPD